ncbi:uncharacterized protein BDR25DRAFT_286419 [Lindgomyces ingoldianus]|uniref:Uncharacterized protein n=1 Tax=Lindgomyces ingoldianus TaxID=673940 RepID=A0ACB6QVJ2_9PLEO|nr:uncharacterized protein BDR25DRAFT_286419 [Lindgomyces ingoldianus]KAF2471039.1 hypothetical protein BDR25DRAFT_286419 [Lindgomyces ingoldianus]
MQLWKTLLSSLTTKRRFAQVRDVQIEFERLKGTRERNVLKQPLQLHSTRPLTGFMRTGYCEAPSSDFGNHSVAAIVTDQFLDFSASRGNDLRATGLTNGCKWCLCVGRWKEAFNARTSDSDLKVPKVYLQRTNERALEGAKLEELKIFALDGESDQ